MTADVVNGARDARARVMPMALPGPDDKHGYVRHFRTCRTDLGIDIYAIWCFDVCLREFVCASTRSRGSANDGRFVCTVVSPARQHQACRCM